MDHVFDVAKKSLLYPRSSQFSSLLTSRCLIFRSHIHFELIFVKAIRSLSRLIFVVNVQFSHHLLKRRSSPLLYICEVFTNVLCFLFSFYACLSSQLFPFSFIKIVSHKLVKKKIIKEKHHLKLPFLKILFLFLRFSCRSCPCTWL